MNPHPLPMNPFAALGLPEWPDLDDETVHAAWRQIAAQTHPDRPDGGDLARYTQACAAYNEICCPWGRSEAYANLVDAASAQGRYDAYPDRYPPGRDPDPDGDLPLYQAAWDTELGPVPFSEIVYQLREIPARFRRGHPVYLALRAVVIAGLCLAVLSLFPDRPWTGPSILVLIAVFAVTARQDMAPPARPVRGCLRPAGADASGGASGSRMVPWPGPG